MEMLALAGRTRTGLSLEPLHRSDGLHGSGLLLIRRPVELRHLIVLKLPLNATERAALTARHAELSENLVGALGGIVCLDVLDATDDCDVRPRLCRNFTWQLDIFQLDDIGGRGRLLFHERISCRRVG